MNRPPVASPAHDSLKKAVLGFGVTVAPLAAIACLQWLFARQFLVAQGWPESEVSAWVVSYFRRNLAVFYAVVGSFAVAYWLLTAALAKGQFLRIRSANVTLALSGIVLMIGLVVASFVRAPEHFLERACPFLGISRRYPFGFDTQSPCEVFAVQGTTMILLGLPVILLATSAVQRILVSRHRWHSHAR